MLSAFAKMALSPPRDAALEPDTHTSNYIRHLTHGRAL